MPGMTVDRDFRLRDFGLSTFKDAETLPRHRWYEVKEAFSPRLVQEAISESGCKRGDLIVDPFGGSGTVSLTATQLGYRTVSFEVNPFLQFLAQAKLANCRPGIFESYVKKIGRRATVGKRSWLERFSTFGRGDGTKPWLFNVGVLRSAEAVMQATAELPPQTRALIRLIAIGAAMDSCNAYRDGKCLRYHNNWREMHLNRKSFLAHFKNRSDIVCSDLAKFPLPRTERSIERGDCRVLIQAGSMQGFRLCITSPPYLNSFDYTDIYRPELFIGGFIESQEELRRLRQSTVRSHVQANWPRPKINSFGPTYDKMIKKMNRKGAEFWDYRLPLMVQAYFEDLHIVLTALREQAAKKAEVWVAVATSAYAGTVIPVDIILAEIGREVGWKVRNVGFLRELRTSGQHWNRMNGNGTHSPYLRESLVMLYQ
jgi:hypothetical protein